MMGPCGRSVIRQDAGPCACRKPYLDFEQTVKDGLQADEVALQRVGRIGGAEAAGIGEGLVHKVELDGLEADSLAQCAPPMEGR